MTDAAVNCTARPQDVQVAAATLSIDLKMLQDNWRVLARQAGAAECGATVKGNAYGLGMEPVGRALWAAGCKTFFVAVPGEGMSLRNALPDATIYVLDGLLAGAAEIYSEHDLRPLLASLEEVDEWRNHSTAKRTGGVAGLHIDTGINRLGLSAGDVAILADNPAYLDGLDISLLISHLACGATPGHEMNRRQLALFNELRAQLPPAPASIANSPGSFMGEEFALDLIRPGIALFGGNPFADRPNPMPAVAHLYAPILQIRDIPPGDIVGYGGAWQASRASKIAILGVGYCDGYPLAAGSHGKDEPAQVLIGGQFCPVAGRVSMDMIAVDITDISDEFARRGVCAEVMGDNVTVDEIAGWAGTISYEILTRLGSRYTRLYSSFNSV